MNKKAWKFTVFIVAVLSSYLRKTFPKLILNILLLCLVLFSVSKSWALEEYSKEWMGLNVQHTLPRNNKWHSFLFSQLRLVNQSKPWQAALVEVGLGYQLTDEKNIWFGYRWTGRNPYNGFYEENRLFQQLINQKRRKIFLFNLRTRLEEITQGNSNQVGLKLRQRLSIESNIPLWKDNFFYSYDEVFFRLNRTNFMSQTIFGENRLFLGVNIRNSKKDWWEVGYINQYQIRTPQQTQNSMSHIISATYNFLT